jgi:hypothetical protein
MDGVYAGRLAAKLPKGAKQAGSQLKDAVQNHGSGTKAAN